MVHIDIEKGGTYLTTFRLPHISLDELLKLGHVDEYTKTQTVDTIMALANEGFCYTGLKKYITGQLDKKAPCAYYCRQLNLDRTRIFAIINPI